MAVTVLSVTFIVGSGFYISKNNWLFTPAFQQRKVAASFVADIVNNKPAEAYALGSDNLKTVNSSGAFAEIVGPMNNSQASVNVTDYKTYGKDIIIYGKIVNHNPDTINLFGMRIINESGKKKIDTLTIFPAIDATDKIALQSQTFALMNKQL